MPNYWTPREVPVFLLFWLRWVFVASHGLSLVEVSGDLWSVGSGHMGSVVAVVGSRACELWCTGLAALQCGIFLGQGSNRCPLHCKVDS